MKKSFYKYKWFIVGLLIIITIPFVGNVADALEKIINTQERISNERIRILEVQPGNKFTLGSSNAGVDIESSVNVDGKTYNVLIDHIPMPEFIGKIDELNGYYDAIVIGRNTSGLSNPYRDYTEINDDGSELGTNLNYSENDITSRKADEIIDFINKGQLVYINSNIVKSNSNIKNSILYKKFNTNNNNNSDLKSKSNFINSKTSIGLSDILKKYLENDADKRAGIEVINTNSDFSNTTTGNVDNRNMKFNIKSKSNINDNEKVSINLYLDIDGDGLFKEQELVKSESNIYIGNSYNITYNMNSNFVGLLEWKIEVIKSSGIKSYIKGNVYLKSLSGTAKNIKVLQIIPNEGSNLDLTSNTNFKNLLKDVNDYNITVEKKTINQFNSQIDSIQLNGVYNMIILGFRDNGYGKVDMNNKAIEKLKSFIQTGQSVMFTHDTIPGYKNANNQQYASYSLLNNFRDYLGQSRFKDIYNSNEIDIYKEYDSVTGKYVEKNIPHYYLSSNADIKGYTRYDHRLQGMKRSTSVRLINKSLITSYPFSIENIKVAQTHNQYYQLNLEDEDVVPWYTISTSSSNNAVDEYDVRNNYYTYSKGNITFSGAGHSSGYTDDELRLFINTIVKAERGANHNPEIESSIDDGIIIEVPEAQDYQFKTTARDLDNDKVRVTVKINGNIIDNINEKLINQGELIDVTIPASYFSTGKNVIVTVEAKDTQDAQAESKTYTFKPSKTPQLELSGDVVNGLIGDQIDGTINIQKLYDDNNKINSVSIKKIDYNEELLQVESKINNISFYNNNAQVRIKITSKYILENEPIKVTISYNVGNNEYRDISTYIYVSSKEGKVNIEVRDESGETVTLNYLKSLINTDDNLIKKSLRRISLSNLEAYIRQNGNTLSHTSISESGKAEFRNLKTGNYEVDIGSLAGFDINCDDKNVNLNYDNNEHTKVFIVNLNSGNKVTMAVKDSSGTINKVYDSSQNSSNYNIKYDHDGYDEIYKLYGRSSVEINFEGQAFNYLEYRFVNKDNNQGTTDWVGMYADSDVLDQPGNLTQMPYDVSDLPTLSGNSIWSNRDLVFNTNNAFNSDTGNISMKVFTNGSSRNPYVSRVEVNGQFVRWQPKTYFVRNHDVGAYANDYKEARKTWGYIKVPESGDYSFETISDDGIYAMLTVNGNTKVIANDFTPRGAWSIYSNESIYLEKDKYYPIYIEYFNWGGSAALEIKYKKDGASSYTNIPSDWFYPSNSKNPIQGGNNTFTGAQNVNFPEVTGTYTIEYRVGTKNSESDKFNILRTGSFGEFAIENRFNLTKSTDVDQVSVGDNLNINYELDPKDITLRELYKISGSELKNKGNIPESLTIKDIRLSDVLPDGLEYINSNEDLGGVFSINYRLNKTGSKSEWKYEADVVNINVSVKAKTIQEIVFEENSGYINYGDVTLDETSGYLWKKDYFNGTTVSVIDSSEIIAHGKYENNSTIGSQQVNIMKNMYYTLGISIDIRNENNILNILLDNDIDVNSGSVFVYKCNENGEIQGRDNNVSIIIDQDSRYIELKNFNPGKYIVTYSVKSISDGTIRASLFNSSGNIINSKDVKLNLQSQELPDLF